MSHCATAPPLPRQFHEPIVKVLGKATGYEAGVFVQHRFLMPKIIRAAGFDPDNLETYGKAEEGWCRSGRDPLGLDRQITKAFLYIRRGKKEPLTVLGPKPGLWGLTEFGVAAAKILNGSEKSVSDSDGKPDSETDPLKGTRFDAALLTVMYDLSGSRAGIALAQKDIIPRVLREVRIDPDNLPAGWTPQQVRCQVQGSHNRRFYGHRDSPFVWAKRSYWALSETGIKCIEEPADKPSIKRSTRPNATARFLNKILVETGGLTGTFWTDLRGALSQRLPLSANAGFVDDHIQNCWLKLIRLDALRGRLESGTVITESHLITYAMRMAFTDIRNMGTEPVCREIYGARTERERKQGIKLPPIEDSRLSWHKEEGKAATWTDVTDESPSLNARMRFEKMWFRLETVMCIKKPRASFRYANILRSLVQGYTVKEIAKNEGVSPYRAAGLIAEARRCMREAAQEGIFTYPDRSVSAARIKA
jgi:hypothetical protein